MISPSVGDRYSAEYATALADAELEILRRLAAGLATGVDTPEWERLQLARIQRVRGDVLAVLQARRPALVARLQASLTAAYIEGQMSAHYDAGERLPIEDRMTEQAQGSIAALANQVAAGYDDATAAIVRTTEDVYRRTVADATAAVLGGSERRVDAVQRVLSQLVGDGVNGIQTRGGRWSIGTYMTMAVRTATARAAITGHEAAMDTLGLDLVIVHPGPRACETCDRWARGILARNGSPGTIQARSAKTNRLVKIEVTGTLAEARSAGWGHPNCRCGLAAYIPGVTDPKTIERPPWDAAGYQAQQQQRGIERQIRAWKQREAIALTPEAAQHARRQTQNWQGRMRDHMDAHPQLKRQGSREQIGRGHDGNADDARATEWTRPDGPRPKRDRPAPPVPIEPEGPRLPPKLDRLPRLGSPDSPVDASNVTNPGQAIERGFQVNCSYVCNAVELRARGLDVIAKPRPGGKRADGRTDREIAADWRNPDGTMPTFTYMPPSTRGAAQLRKRVREAVDEWDVGARGYIVGQWRQGGGHIWNIERTEDGFRMIEGQVHAMQPEDVEGYFDRLKAPSVGVLRTDNLDPTDALDDAVEARTAERVAELHERAAAAYATRIRGFDVAIERGQEDLERARRDLADAIASGTAPDYYIPSMRSQIALRERNLQTNIENRKLLIRERDAALR